MSGLTLAGKLRVIEMEEFPWTYDQFQRYSVLREFIEAFFPGKKIKVLDAGGLSPDREGRTFWLPLKHVISGQSYILDVTYCKENDFIQGDGIHLPFKNESFEVAAALDVIEHLSEKEREEFIKELCRVSKSSIILSAPFRDERIEEVEKLLFEQIKKFYGAEHGQLLEHKEHGLPEINTMSQILGKYTASGLSFSYGSLKNWLFLQSLKNCFMFKKNSGIIHYVLDKWMTYRNLSSEFEPPFSRHFWLYSKDMDQKKLESGVEIIKENLREKITVKSSISELQSLNREIVDFFARESVSALVVISGKGKYLVECLNHLLTQKVDFDLEVTVWDIKRDAAAEKMIEARFPGVKYFCPEKKEKTANALLKVAAKLKGDYILILSEDVLLPLESISNLYDHLKEAPQVSLLSPRIVWKRYFSSVWGGRKVSLNKVFAGRAFTPFWKFKGEKAGWIFSECLFFRREALFERKLKRNYLKKRNIFLWERTGTGRKILYVPEIVVYKK